ncbi:hypothetical protein [Streptomyces albidoflavus]|uniref:hypothetical protein n=1 Tax=Streptomyces albidoflavus TaxID=1886 RepID=UPI003D10031E
MQGLATFAAAAVMGWEEFGADEVLESLKASFGSAQDAILSDRAFAEMAAAASQTECWGRQLVRPQWQSTADKVRLLDATDYEVICQVRHVLAVLVESALPLRLAFRAGLQDPALQHIGQVRASNPRTRYYLDCADFISRRPPAEAWEEFVPLLVSICTMPARLETFQQDVTVLDPALDDVHGLGRRAAALLAPALPAAGKEGP